MGLLAYEVTKDANCMPEFSFEFRISNLFRNNTKLTDAKILLEQITCHNDKESAYASAMSTVVRTINDNATYQSIDFFVFGKKLIEARQGR